MGLPKKTNAENPFHGEETYRVCPIVSKSMFEGIDYLISKNNQASLSDPLVNKLVIDGRLVNVKPIDYGYSSLTNTVHVLDPSILPPGSKPVSWRPSENTVSYEELFTRVLKNNPNAAVAVRIYEKDRDLVKAIRELFDQYMHLVVLESTPWFFPDARLHAVEVPVGPGGVWSGSPRGKIVFLPKARISDAAWNSWRVENPALRPVTGAHEGLTRKTKSDCTDMMTRRKR